MSPGKSATTAAAATAAAAAGEAATTSNNNLEQDGPQIKRMRSNGSACSLSSSLDGAEAAAAAAAAGLMPGAAGSPSGGGATSAFMQHFQQNMQTLLRPSLVDLACTYFGRPHEYNAVAATPPTSHLYPPASILQAALPTLPALGLPHNISVQSAADDSTTADELDELDVGSETAATETTTTTAAASPALHTPPDQLQQLAEPAPTKRKGFSISAILGGGS